MSRSRRHTPVIKDDGHSHKGAKVASNRLARRTKRDLPVKGNYAHRIFTVRYHRETIVSRRQRISYRDAVRKWEKEEAEHVTFTPLHNRFASKEHWLAYWKRHYSSK